MSEEAESISDSTEDSGYELDFCTDTTLSKKLEEMVNNQLFSDVTFVVGSDKKCIYAHKLQLVVASEYFNRMFCGNFVEATLSEVVLEDVDPELFLIILRLVYAKKVRVNWDNIRDIFDCLQKFLLDDFYYPLIKFLNDQIVDQESVMGIFRENGHFKLEAVDEKCMHYIRNNPFYFFDRKDFTTLNEERLEKIMKTAQLNCTKDQLKLALDNWLSENPDADDEKLRKYCMGTVRTFYAHKLPVTPTGNISSTTTVHFKLRLTSPKPLSLHGFGILVSASSQSVFGTVKISFDHQDTERHIGDYKFTKKVSPGDEIMDIMFDELSLVQNRWYNFIILANGEFLKRNNYLPCRMNHENIGIEIEFFYIDGPKQYLPYFSYILAKYPECIITGEGGSALCCNSKWLAFDNKRV